MIDWDRVQELEEEVGAEDFEEVFQLFLEEVEEQIALLIANSSHEAMESTLHFLKGSALNLGFYQFSQLCQAGESSAAMGKIDTVDRHAIIASFHLSKQVFLSEIAGHQAA